MLYYGADPDRSDSCSTDLAGHKCANKAIGKEAIKENTAKGAVHEKGCHAASSEEETCLVYLALM